MQSPFKSGITSDPPTFGDNGTIHYLVCDGGLADAIVAAISETNPVLTEVAKLQGIAIASVFQIILTHAGRGTYEGRSQTEIADELYPIIEAVLDELDRWLTTDHGSEARRR